MMGTWFFVVTVAWSCPGGMLSRFIPDRAKPVLCEVAETRTTQFMRKDDALTWVNKSGPYALPAMFWCQAGRCWSKPLSWSQVAEIKR